uniref:RWD domain-containing protein 1-like n=1 Tax=Erigeron canadensis TaxID=72917 RepID=UPI001CB89749|nr:RWD domain-containing protein 1-like [Erigeron canadensis]
MEIEALKAILMDEFEEIQPSISGLNTSNPCFQIKLCLKEDETDSIDSVQLGFIFSHTEKYPDEIPLLNLKSIKGTQISDLKVLKEKLEQEASENLGMAMIYTLVTSAKEWLAQRFAQDTNNDNMQEAVAAKDEITVPHGEPVTIETFLAWREKFEAEMALERAKLLPESALAGTKEKKITGKEWFLSGRASTKRAAPIIEGSNDEDEDDFDIDVEVDEEDMLDHYLSEKLESSNQTSA